MLPADSHLPIAAQISRDFVREVSRRLLSQATYRSEPSLVSLGYWFRDTAVDRWLEHAFPSGRWFQPRGLVFHVPPSNVDTTWAYLWLLSLLAGNANVVRLPQHRTAMIVAMERVFDDVLNGDKYTELKALNLFVRYSRDEALTATYSQACDVRVVVGSDRTIQDLRAISLRPEATELNMAGKSSFVVADVSAVLAASYQQIHTWTAGLWQDVRQFDQGACNSPRAILWLGGDVSERQAARKRFWAAFETQVQKIPASWTAAGIVQRQSALDLIGLAEKGARLVSDAGASVARVWLEQVLDFDPWFSGSGQLFEFGLQNLASLRCMLVRRHQTVISIGVSADEWAEFLSSPVAGIDRVVRPGEALNFDAVWDGFDLGRVFTREIVINL